MKILKVRLNWIRYKYAGYISRLQLLGIPIDADTCIEIEIRKLPQKCPDA